MNSLANPAAKPFLTISVVLWIVLSVHPAKIVRADDVPSVTAADEATAQAVPQVQHEALAALLDRPLSQVTMAGALRPTPVLSSGVTETQLFRPDIVELPGSDVLLAGHNFGVTVGPNRNRHRISYRPLYFEDPNLERCGASHGLFTDAVSAAHFFGRIPMTPYLLTAQPPERCVAALPDCPSCARFGHDAYLPPPTQLAVTTESAAVVGLIFLIP